MERNKTFHLPAIAEKMLPWKIYVIFQNPRII